MEDLAYELNFESARLAREAARRGHRGRRRTGRATSPARLGPTNRTASISPDVNDPGARNVSFEQLVEAYLEQANGPGRRRRRPAAGRDDLRHAQRQGRDLRARDAVRGARPPLAGDDLRHHHRRLRAHPVRPGHRGVLELGAARPAAARSGSTARSAPAEMRPYLAELSRIADCFVSCYPNAGLPNAFGEYDEAAGPDRRRSSRSSPSAGLVNLLGGCCGTTPDAHRRDRRAWSTARRRARPPSRRPRCGSPGSSR